MLLIATSLGSGRYGGDRQEVQIRRVIVGEGDFEGGKAAVASDVVVPRTQERRVIRGLDGVQRDADGEGQEDEPPTNAPQPI